MKKQIKAVAVGMIALSLAPQAFASAPLGSHERGGKGDVSKPLLVGAVAVFDDGKKSVSCSVPNLNSVTGENRITRGSPETLGYPSCNAGQMAVLNQLSGPIRSVDAKLNQEAFLGKAASKLGGVVWRGAKTAVAGLICTDAGLRMRSIQELKSEGHKVENEVVVVGVVAPAVGGLLMEGANQFRHVNAIRNPAVPLPEIKAMGVRANKPVFAAAAGRGISVCGLLFGVGYATPELDKASKASVEQGSKAVTYFKLFMYGPTQTNH